MILAVPQKKKEHNSVRITFLLAQREGFEPSCGVIHKLISSQPRYDRFDTSAYEINEYADTVSNGSAKQNPRRNIHRRWNTSA